jgi:hypothetical protein
MDIYHPTGTKTTETDLRKQEKKEGSVRRLLRDMPFRGETIQREILRI